MIDPLAQFRKKPASVAVESTPPKGGNEYAAFETLDRVGRLKIRRANAPTRAPGYAFLLDVVYDGPYGTNFVLVYTFLIVDVKGRNLQAIAAAIETSTADFIQEFDANRWQKPQDDKTPFIESIEVVVQESGPSISETERTGSEKAPGRSQH